MDAADRAEQLESATRDEALARHRARRPETPLLIDGERVCGSCFEAIEPRRLLAVPDAVRCTQCQEDVERYQWTGR